MLWTCAEVPHWQSNSYNPPLLQTSQTARIPVGLLYYFVSLPFVLLCPWPAGNVTYQNYAFLTCTSEYLYRPVSYLF